MTRPFRSIEASAGAARPSSEQAAKRREARAGAGLVSEATSASEATHGPRDEMSTEFPNPAKCPPTNDRGENHHEGDRGNGPGGGNGRDEAGRAARAAGSDKRRRRSGSCVGIHLG